MNDMKQPEALRLARELEGVYPVNIHDQEAAAAELRRLHAECDKRMQAINGLTKLANGYHDELLMLRDAVKRLHAAKGRHHAQLAACDLFDLCGLKNERPTK